MDLLLIVLLIPFAMRVGDPEDRDVFGWGLACFFSYSIVKSGAFAIWWLASQYGIGPPLVWPPNPHQHLICGLLAYLYLLTGFSYGAYRKQHPELNLPPYHRIDKLIPLLLTRR